MTMAVGKVNTTKAQIVIGEAAKLLDGAQGQEVVMGTAQVAAVAAPLRSLERTASLLRLAAALVEIEMLNLRDGKHDG